MLGRVSTMSRVSRCVEQIAAYSKGDHEIGAGHRQQTGESQRMGPDFSPEFHGSKAPGEKIAWD